MFLNNCLRSQSAFVRFFKYADFFLRMAGYIADVEMPQLNLPLPIGISFYTFQTMSYVIDVYRKEVKVQKKTL